MKLRSEPQSALRLIQGGAKPSTAPPPPPRGPGPRLARALGRFLADYAQKERAHRSKEDTIDPMTMAGVLLTQAVRIAEGEMGDRVEEFVEATRAIYEARRRERGEG